MREIGILSECPSETSMNFNVSEELTERMPGNKCYMEKQMERVSFQMMQM